MNMKTNMNPINPWLFYLMCGTPFWVLLALKLTGLVAWSWWWITLPLWLPVVVAGIILLMLAAAIWWPRKYVRKDK